MVNAEAAQELGAMFDSEARLLGASAERLVKLIQSTAMVLSKSRIAKKWLQVICGRWVHILRFRRAGMATLQQAWKWIGGKKLSIKLANAARKGLAKLCAGACLFHTFLGAEISQVATASDASGKGGAVGRADVLSDEGKQFCAVRNFNLVCQ